MKRVRDAAATREAILESARVAFARAGYDGVGVREIAAGAGVTAMLVNRYFGSKAELFAEVVVRTMAAPTILTRENLASPDRGEAFATALERITRDGATPLDGFKMLLYSASSEAAAKIGRDEIEQHYHRTLTAALKGDHAAERAALVFALVAGVQVMRQMLGLTALADAEPRTLVRLLAPLFEQLLGKPREQPKA